MIDTTTLTALNEQFNFERANETFYRALGAALDYAVWPGMARHMMGEADSESAHALRVMDYIIDHNKYPMFEGLPAPMLSENIGPLEALSLALMREEETTARLKALYFTAEAAEDVQTCNLSRSMLDHQLESEKELADLITQWTRAAGDYAAMLVLDGAINA